MNGALGLEAIEDNPLECLEPDEKQALEVLRLRAVLGTNLHEGVLFLKESNPDIIPETYHEIVETFLDYNAFLKEGSYFEKKIAQRPREIAVKIKKWLLLSDQATVNIMLDWVINRIDQAEESIGLSRGGFITAQRQQAEKYGYENPVHLQLGPGDGKLSFELMRQDPTWEQISIGDRVQVAPESVLDHFIRPENRDNIAFNDFLEQILTNILKKGLAQEWFENVGIRERELRLRDGVAFTDLNDIRKVFFAFLNGEHSKMLEDLYSLESSEVRWSYQFELDKQDLAPLQVAIIILKMLIPEPELQGKEIGKKKLELQAKLRDDITFLKGLLERENQKYSREIENRIQSIKRNIFFDHIGNSNYSKREVLERLILQLEFAIDTADRFFDRKDTYFSTSDPQSLFDELFTDEFVEQLTLESSDADALDLNEFAQMYVGGFYKGDFRDLSHVIPDGKEIALISDIRATSHLPNAVYEDVMYEVLNLMVPGARFFSDGIRESYTNYYRIDQIERAIDKAGRSDFHIDYVLGADGEIVSILIQRKHPQKGYATLEEKRNEYGKEISFVSKQEATSSPIFREVQRIKESVASMTTEYEKRFRGLDVERMLVMIVATRLLNSQEYEQERLQFQKWRREVVKEYSYEEMVTIISEDANMHLRPDIRRIIEAVHIGEITPEILDAIEDEKLEVDNLYELVEDMIVIRGINEGNISIHGSNSYAELFDKFIAAKGIFHSAMKIDAEQQAEQLIRIGENPHVKGASENIGKALGAQRIGDIRSILGSQP